MDVKRAAALLRVSCGLQAELRRRWAPLGREPWSAFGVKPEISRVVDLIWMSRDVTET